VSYNTDAEGPVSDLWKTATRNDCKEVWFLLLDYLVHRPK